MQLTATGKELALQKFYNQLAADAAERPDVYPATVTELARRAGVGRPYLSWLLNSDPRTTGELIWRKVLPHLSIPALFHLEQCSAWNTQAAAALRSLSLYAYGKCRAEDYWN
jgi:hypothetical protein